MTEQEAEAWVIRLRRIWEPEKMLLAERNRVQGFTWKAKLKNGLCVHTATYRGEMLFDINFEKDDGRHDESLIFDTQYNTHSGPGLSTRFPESTGAEAEERRQRFTTKWLPFFRRSCWLSGCPIEASVHEKAEWIQGFTHEDIQTWNLKF